MFLARECLRGRIMSRQLLNTFRRSVTTGTLHQKLAGNNNNTSDSRRFTVIYKCPGVIFGSLINRLKKVQLYLTGTSVPFSYGLYLTDYCSADVPVSMASLSVLSILGTMALGQFFIRTIGFVYISEDKQEVKISYIDFWGCRKDEFLSCDEIIPESHSPRYVTDRFYRNVFLTSSVKPLKLMKSGQITDPENFYKVFSYYSDDSETLDSN